MKVYVLAPDYGYEGLGEPKGAYATRDLAEVAKKGKDGYTYYEIFELEVEGAIMGDAQ